MLSHHHGYNRENQVEISQNITKNCDNCQFLRYLEKSKKPTIFAPTTNILFIMKKKQEDPRRWGKTQVQSIRRDLQESGDNQVIVDDDIVCYILPDDHLCAVWPIGGNVTAKMEF